MKRLVISVCMLFTVLLMTGCGSKTKMESAKANLDSAFECDMKIFYDDSEFDGKLTRMGMGEWETCFTAPDSLDGVMLSFSGKDVTASYKGLSFTVPKKALPIKSILTNLMNVVDELAAAGELECTGKNGVMVSKGETEGGEYELSIDAETGCISGFEMKNVGVKMEFENVEINAGSHMIGNAVSEPAGAESDMIMTTDAAVTTEAVS